MEYQNYDLLKKENKELKDRIRYLENLLDINHINYKQEDKPKTKENIKNETITKQHVIEFFRVFKGRQDVYSKRSVSKDGRVGYYPQCYNYWQEGLCPKKDGKKVDCKKCINKSYKQLKSDVLLQHFLGRDEKGRDVIGIYPMFEDETTNLLVFDFDNHEIGNDGENKDNQWLEEVNTFRKICQLHHIDILVERSRSGNGVHIWIFFDKPILAMTARNFGKALLNVRAESINLKTFQTYDRMIPAQDHLSKDGLGNLIALPLQGQAVKKNNSVFVDENWQAYYDQWNCIRNVKRLSVEFIEEKLQQWGTKGILKTDANYEGIEKPWIKNRHFDKEDVDGIVEIDQANMLYINTTNLKPRIQNRIRQLAVFSNREFYKRRNSGLSVRGIDSNIQCSFDINQWICLPRGCLAVLKDRLDESQINYKINDHREIGQRINVEFNGELYDNQKRAVDALLKKDIGILNATTAFGKTVVGTYLIAQRKVNTLIIVHTNLIMNNWEDDLNNFLIINEEIPTYITPSGKKKKRKQIIGKLYSGHNSLNGIIDIVSVNSLITNGNVKEFVKNYGMVIVDECHHAPSHTLYTVLNEISAKYLYGFTATIKRDDGLEQKTYMQLGPILYKYTTKERIEKQGIPHYVYPRFTRFVELNQKDLKLNDWYKLVIQNEIRNKQILSDIHECMQDKRTILIITKFKDHAKYFYKKLHDQYDQVVLLVGGKGDKENKEIKVQLNHIQNHESVILIATAQYVGEGFNFPRLDTLFLTVPVSVESCVEQYSGRLHRHFEGKKDVMIYDYIDSHILQLEKMYHKRLRTYKKMGYEICSNIHVKENEIQMIYDFSNYQKIFDKDIENANREIIIVTPGVNQTKVDDYLPKLIKKLEDGIHITIITLDYQVYPNNIKEKTKVLIDMLKRSGITLITMQSLYEHYAIIDKEITWYGSMNLLSKVKKEDNMMRITDLQVVYELLK